MDFLHFARINDGFDISYEEDGGVKDDPWGSGLQWMVEILRAMYNLRVQVIEHEVQIK